MQFFCYGRGFETWRRVLSFITTNGLAISQLALKYSSGCKDSLIIELVYELYPEIGSLQDYIKST